MNQRSASKSSQWNRRRHTRAKVADELKRPYSNCSSGKRRRKLEATNVQPKIPTGHPPVPGCY
uniref:Uncharacterized protein n=1 Tax=Anopheles quadriannulatus TaxID=34691 RepID=A0A182XHZ6_ANOQN